MTTKNMGNKPKKVSVHQLKHDAFTREFIFNPLMAKRYAIKKHDKKTSTITTEGIIMFEQAEFCHLSNWHNVASRVPCFLYRAKRWVCQKAPILHIVPCSRFAQQQVFLQ